MAKINLNRYMHSGLLGMHFTPEELFIGTGKQRGKQVEINALDCINIKDHFLEGGEYNQQTLVPLIQQALKHHQIKTRRAVISFPVKFPWIREIKVPRVPAKELDQIVRLEVERLYLDSTVEKLIDYMVIERPESDAEGKISVLSCSIPRNAVSPYVELLTAANLELVGIDLAEVNVMKLASMQGINFSDGISIILNVSMYTTDLIVMEKDTLQLIRKVSQGKKQLQDIIYANIAHDAELAAGMDNLDFLLPTKFFEYTAKYVNDLLTELRRSVDFYLNDIKKADGSVSKVVLAGSGYWPANLPTILSQQLNLPLVDLRFPLLKNILLETKFSEQFPALSVFAPVVGSVVKGEA